MKCYRTIESGALKATQANFANVKGYFFHLCFNVWRHIQNIRLQVRCMEEPGFALQLRMFTALAFFPPQDVVRGFASICNKIRKNFGDVTEKPLFYF